MAAPLIGKVGIGVEVDASLVPKQLKSVGEKLGDALGKTVKVGVGAAVGTVAAGAAAVGGAAALAFSKGFDRLTAIDNAKSKLKGLKFTTEEVQSVMESALKAVKGTAFGLGDAATIASVFGATGVKAGDDMTRALKLTADMATVGGTSLQDMGDVLSDVSAMGHVTGDTLNRLGERGIDALGNIAGSLGVTREEARKMVSSGEVDFEEFATAMEQNVGDAAKASGETFQGAMANIMAAIGRLGADALSPMFEAVKGVAPIIIEAIDGITAAFKPIFEEVGPKVAGVITGIGDTIAKIDWAAVATIVQDAWHAVEDLFGRLAGKTEGLQDTFGIAWQAIIDWVGSIDWQKVGDWIVGAWGAVTTAIQGVIDIVGALWDAGIGALFEEIGGKVTEIDWDGVAGTIEDISGAMVKWAPAIWGVVGAYVAFKAAKGVIGIVDGIKSGMQGAKAAMDIYRKGVTLTTAITYGLSAAGWEEAAATWAANAAFLANPITWIVVGIVALIAALILLIANWDTVVKFITDTWSKFMDWITPVLDGFVEWWTALWDTVVTFFTDIWTGVTDWFKGIWESISGWFQDVWEGITSFLEDSGIVDTFKAIWQGIQDFFQGVMDNIKFQLDLVRNFFRFWAAIFQWAWENLIQPALKALGDFFVWLWEEQIKPVIDWIVEAIETFGDAVVDLWETYVAPTVQAIGDFFTWLWEKVIEIVIGFINAEIEGWGKIFQWLYDYVIKPVGDAIAGVFDWLWKNAIKPIIDFIVKAIEGWGIIFQWLYDYVIKPVWEGIQEVFKNAWEWIDQHVFTPFKDGIGLIQTAFQNVADALPAIWDTIKKAVAEPINFVLGTIWNDGLRSFWNDLVTELDLKDMKLPKADLVSFARGGVLPGYTPGRDVHQFWSPTGGRLALSGGEGIIRPDALRKLGGKRWLDAVNGSRGRIGDGDGKNWVGDIWDKVQQAAKIAWEFFADPAGAIKKYVVDGIIKPLVSAENPNIFGKTVAGVIGNFVGGFADIFSKASPGGPKTAGMGWEAMQKIVLANIPGASITSTFRKGAKTVNGGQSYHALGRAIDIIPANMNTFEAVRRMFPNASELIYTPAGLRQLQNGKSHANWSDAVKRMHYNHVHLAMKNGGIFDNGGWLKPGGVGMNMGRKPEAVFTAAQFAALEKNLIQMDRLLGAVDSRSPRGGLFAGTGREASSSSAATMNTMTIAPGAIQITGSDPYKTSLLVVDRIAERVSI